MLTRRNVLAGACVLFPTMSSQTSTKGKVLTVQENFSKCIQFVLAHEGGFVNHPRDPGGATKYGITKRTLEAFYGRPVTVQEVRDMPRSVAETLYERQYWPPFSSLPAGLDLCAFDFGVNAGPGRSLQHVAQRRLVKGGFKDDMKSVIDSFCSTRIAYYRTLNTFPTFGRGWLKRVEASRQAAYALLPAT